MITANITISAASSPTITLTGAVAQISVNLSPVIQTVRWDIAMPTQLREKEVVIAEGVNMFTLERTPQLVELYTESESGMRRKVALDYYWLGDTITIESGDDYDKVIIVYL